MVVLIFSGQLQSISNLHEMSNVKFPRNRQGTPRVARLDSGNSVIYSLLFKISITLKMKDSSEATEIHVFGSRKVYSTQHVHIRYLFRV